MPPAFLSILPTLLVLIGLSWFIAPIFWARNLLAIGRWWAGLRVHQAEVNACTWRYLDGGKGPVLILVHGFGADADHWLLIARSLTRNFRVIAPDMPGFGHSTSDNKLEFDIESQLKRLHDFIEALDVTPAVIVGSSMGGWITTAYAARYPVGIRAIWLMGPLGVNDCVKSPMQSAITQNIESPFQIENLRQFRQWVLAPMFGSPPWIPYPLQVNYVEESKKLSHSAAAKFDQILHESAPLESYAEKLDIPVLLQWGTKDYAVDVSGVPALEKAIPGLSVHVQDGVGHLPMLETPFESIRFFKEFSDRHNLGKT